MGRNQVVNAFIMTYIFFIIIAFFCLHYCIFALVMTKSVFNDSINHHGKEIRLGPKPLLVYQPEA